MRQRVARAPLPARAAERARGARGDGLARVVSLRGVQMCRRFCKVSAWSAAAHGEESPGTAGHERPLRIHGSVETAQERPDCGGRRSAVITGQH